MIDLPLIAKEISELAQLTARGGHQWQRFEVLVEDRLRNIYDSGREEATDWKNE